MISESTFLSVLTLFILFECVHLVHHYAVMNRFFKTRLFELKEPRKSSNLAYIAERDDAS